MSLRWPVILFDLDGTLIDTINLIVTSYQHAFETVIGRCWDEAEVKSWIGTSLIDAFVRELGPDDGMRAYRAYIEFNEAHTEELISGYPGIPELVADVEAAGAKIAVVTSKRREPAELGLALCGLGHIPVLIAHEDVAEHKPSPVPLLTGLEMLGGGAEQTVYVGDAAVDIQAARNAGLSVIAVTWGAGTRCSRVVTQARDNRIPDDGKSIVTPDTSPPSCWLTTIGARHR